MKKLIFLPLALYFLAGFSATGLAKSPSGNVQKKWHCEQIGFADYPYQSFLKNWDDAAYPLFYALITSDEAYGQYFAPAAVMGNTKPYKPEPGFYQTSSLLVVARLTKPAATGRSIFSLVKCVKNNGVITLCYKLGSPNQNATFTLKDGLVIRFDKAPVRKIVIYENSRKVGEINPGHDSFPTDKPSGK